MVIHLLTAYFFVILPLPSREAAARYTTARYNRHLFSYIDEFHAAGGVFDLRRPSTWMNLFTSFTALEPMFNVLLTVPFGIWLHWYQKWKFLPTMLAGFFLSLFFELTQLSGLYFLYPRPYRLFDVNDLMTNTIGACLGWLISPLIMKLFPDRDAIDDQAVRGGYIVSYPRRLFCHLADTLILSVICVPLSLFLHRRDPSMDLTILITLIFVITGSLYLWLSHGRTFGMRLVRIRLIRETNEKAPLLIQCLCRQILVRGILLGGILIFFGSTVDHLSFHKTGIFLACMAAVWTATLLNMFLHHLSGDRQLWFGRLSRTIYISDMHTEKIAD